MKATDEAHQSVSIYPEAKIAPSATRRYIMIIILLFITCISVLKFSFKPRPLYTTLSPSLLFNASENTSRVLVIYVYADTHSMSKSNLEFFIRVAVLNSSNVDYYFILQQLNNKSVSETDLPKLPSYAHYIQHENQCFDIGTVGWFIQNGTISIVSYKYFIFLNASVRGPYLTSFYDHHQWYEAFTSRLNDYTKLVGPTISCEGTPHVQSHFWTIDRQGLSILLKNGIFKCHQDKGEAVFQGEIPASQVIFKANLSIDSLMKKFQGVDFRKNSNPRNCAAAGNPTKNGYVDGISLDPFELVFVKLKYHDKDYEHVRSRVVAYDRWIL